MYSDLSWVQSVPYDVLCIVFLRESYVQSYSCIVSDALPSVPSVVCVPSFQWVVCLSNDLNCVCVPSIPFYDMWAIRFACCLGCRSSHVLSRRSPVSWVICVPSVQCFACLPTKLCCMCGIRPKNYMWAKYFHGLCCNCSCFVYVLINLYFFSNRILYFPSCMLSVCCRFKVLSVCR